MMSDRILSGYEPANVWKYFEEICGIPHGSSNIRAISDWLAATAREHGLKYVQEPCGNVIIYADATPGYENEPAIALQGHMDMVAVKDPDCDIDMEKDGLSLFIEDGFLGARGTTLGGDDGIAIAYGLAILTDPSIPHPALTLVATVNEETGMDGAIAMDPAVLSARRLINLDSEDEGEFIAGCAGGATLRLRMPLTRCGEDAELYEITLDGLQGGHSGSEIDKNRSNAILLLARVIRDLKKQGVKLVSINGGTKDNAIPNAAAAVVTAAGGKAPDITAVTAELKNALAGKEDGLRITVKKCDGKGCLAEENGRQPDGAAQGGAAGNASVLTAECEEKLLNLLNLLPYGPAAMSTLPGLVETSDNVGIISVTDNLAEIAVSVRSLIESEKQRLIDQISLLAELLGASVSRNSEYPGWQYRTESPIRDKAVGAFADLYGCEPKVRAIHAGLECGLLIDKIPDLDAISMGPQMHDVHTTKERLSIESVRNTWELLLHILAKKD